MATKEDLQLELEQIKAENEALKLAQTNITPAPTNLPTRLSSEEIQAHQAAGNVIGNTAQQLTSGHDESGLQKWEKWHIELRLNMVVNAKGKEVSAPYEFYAVKQLNKNLIGSDLTFQTMNKQNDFRLTSVPNYHVYHFPAGSVEAGKTYECGMYPEVVGKGVSAVTLDRILFKQQEKATKA